MIPCYNYNSVYYLLVVVAVVAVMILIYYLARPNEGVVNIS